MSNLELQTEAKTPLVPSSCTHAKDVSILECLIFTQITHFDIFSKWNYLYDIVRNVKRWKVEPVDEDLLIESEDSSSWPFKQQQQM